MVPQFSTPHFNSMLPGRSKPRRAQRKALGCAGCGCGGCGVGGFDIPIDQLPFGIGTAITGAFTKIRSEAGAGAEAAVKPIVSTAVAVSLVATGVAAAALITLLVINSKKKK